MASIDQLCGMIDKLKEYANGDDNAATRAKEKVRKATRDSECDKAFNKIWNEFDRLLSNAGGDHDWSGTWEEVIAV